MKCNDIIVSFKTFKTNLKEHCVDLEEKFNLRINLHSNIELIIQTQKYLFHNWINKLFSEEDPEEHSVKLERWQGPPHTKKIVWNCVVL